MLEYVELVVPESVSSTSNVISDVTAEPDPPPDRVVPMRHMGGTNP